MEGGDIHVLGRGAVLIGMGERSTPMGVEILARELFRHRASNPDLVSAFRFERPVRRRGKRRSVRPRVAINAADRCSDEPLGWGPSRRHALGAMVGDVAGVEDPPPAGGSVTFCCRAKTGGMACIHRVKWRKMSALKTAAKKHHTDTKV